MGNMTCRNTASGTGHTCAGSTPTGATLTYDNEGRLSSWTAQVNKTGSDTFLYDGEGNRVLQSASSTTNGVTTVTDTLTFDGYSETTLSGGTTTTLTYYSLNGERLAVQHNTNLVKYLISDLLGSTAVAVNSAGSIIAVQLYWPYGSNEYSWGTMPTTYNFTGQRLDSVTGLLYFNARYYDPLSGRFVRADTVQNNASGMDPYAYVGDSPIGTTDPSGQYYSNGIPTNQQGGETAYIYGDEMTTVTNSGSDWGSDWTISGQYSHNDSGLSINSSTFLQVTKYGGYNPDTDPNNSPWAKFQQVTGWTTLQQSWNAPGADTQSRLNALLQFAGTNANNLFQLAAILGGGPEDEGVEAVDEAIEAGDTTPIDLFRSGRGNDPALDAVRPNHEFTPGADGSEVLYPGQTPPNGLSTFDSINGTGKWWKLPAGSPIPDGLQFVNDQPGHWTIVPISSMSKDDYIALVMQTLDYWEGPIRVK
jgi:RHS repeat-associated protein